MRHCSGNSLEADEGLIDPNFPISLVRGKAFQSAVRNIPQHLRGIPEEALRQTLKPTQTDIALKMALWNELRVAVHTGKPVIQQRIVAGICTYANWSSRILKNPERLAWILAPSHEFSFALRTLYLPLMKRAHEILALNIMKADGSVNIAQLKVQVSLFSQIINCAGVSK